MSSNGASDSRYIYRRFVHCKPSSRVTRQWEAAKRHLVENEASCYGPHRVSAAEI